MRVLYTFRGKFSNPLCEIRFRLLGRDMRLLQTLLFFGLAILALLVGGCSGEKPVEKAILGTWVQETPISMTTDGIQTTTADTVLRLKKNGETHLTRNLDIAAQGLPADGVKISIELRGRWEISNGQLKQVQDIALIIPRTEDETARKWADQLQTQANDSPPTVKDIISVDKRQLILQDVETGATDVYRKQ